MKRIILNIFTGGLVMAAMAVGAGNSGVVDDTASPHALVHSVGLN